MSAQPVHEEHPGDPEDPQVIHDQLPERERAEFLRQYRAALTAARADVANYKDLKKLLHHWALAVVATNKPGYYEAMEAAKNGTGDTTDFFDAINAEIARRAS
jgi:Family of unknown function (DUF6247)